MKENKRILSIERNETLYECPACQKDFAAFTIIEEREDSGAFITISSRGWKQIPTYCIYCGAKMEEQ